MGSPMAAMTEILMVYGLSDGCNIQSIHIESDLIAPSERTLKGFCEIDCFSCSFETEILMVCMMEHQMAGLMEFNL